MSSSTSEGDITCCSQQQLYDFRSFRPNCKSSKRNIPAAAGSAEAAETASSSHNGNVVNGGDAAMNGFGGSDVDEDMEIN